MEHSPTLEKAITVYGQPENCSAACRRILEVMEEEAKNVGKPTEISLKILAHNNLIGRIIGKQGGTIKKIMEVSFFFESLYIVVTSLLRTPTHGSR